MKKIFNFIIAMFKYRDRMDEGAVAPSPMTIIDIMGGIYDKN